MELIAETYDVVICGGGLAGLTLARQLNLQNPNIAIAVLDKMAHPLPEAIFKVGESTVEVGAFGHTSIGIVARQDLHPLKNYYNYELAYQWLQKNEPIFAFYLEGKQPEDFKKMPKYSYSSKQVFSYNRWACVGEAGTFLDPFYSPGTDNIGFGNSLTTQLIELDLEGKLTQEKVADANHFYLSYSDGVTFNVQNAYNCLGNGIVMATKFIWDILSGWTFSGLMMFNSTFLKQEFRTKVQHINSQFSTLSFCMQQLFKDWANESLHQINFEFIDYLAIPFVDELRSRNLKYNQTESEIIDNYLSSLKLLEEVAQVMFQLAIEDTMPEMLSEVKSYSWLNAWAISLDVTKWKTDGLFNPKSEPRNFSIIKQQLWEAIG